MAKGIDHEKRNRIQKAREAREGDAEMAGEYERLGEEERMQVDKMIAAIGSQVWIEVPAAKSKDRAKRLWAIAYAMKRHFDRVARG